MLQIERLVVEFWIGKGGGDFEIGRILEMILPRLIIKKRHEFLFPIY